MAADLGLLSLSQLQNLAHSQQQQQNPSSTAGSWMWNTTRQNQDDDDSWEVRAFAQDTGNIMGTTWPPRSYTCTFCRREFRSAQALGGHMNVHRRDRARLRQSPPVSINDPSLSPNSSSAILFPTQEFVANGGLCLLYSLPSPNSVFNSNSMNGCVDPSTLLSISPYQTPNQMASCPTLNFSQMTNVHGHGSVCQTDKLEPTVSMDNNSHEDANNHITSNEETNHDKMEVVEELDLELRLRPPRPQQKQV